MRSGLGKIGVYRDDDGVAHGVSLRCTHLGCLLHFNAAERSWDCPCHGSRFDVDGGCSRARRPSRSSAATSRLSAGRAIGACAAGRQPAAPRPTSDGATSATARRADERADADERDEPDDAEENAEQPEEAPEPHEMFARTRDEGERRLSRTRLELATTSLVAGFDIVFGVIAIATVTAADDAAASGPSAAHLVGSLFFGIAFIFIVVGRSELFTENFLVPITALRRGKLTTLKLAELWTISPVMNILGGTALILIVSTKGVLPEGTAAGAQRARRPHRRPARCGRRSAARSSAVR